jgi:hypothetical protein
MRFLTNWLSWPGGNGTLILLHQADTGCKPGSIGCTECAALTFRAIGSEQREPSVPRNPLQMALYL